MCIFITDLCIQNLFGPIYYAWVCLFVASETESEIDKSNKEAREKMKQEYFFAIQEEGEHNFFHNFYYSQINTSYLLIVYSVILFYSLILWLLSQGDQKWH